MRGRSITFGMLAALITLASGAIAVSYLRPVEAEPNPGGMTVSSSARPIGDNGIYAVSPKLLPQQTSSTRRP